MNEQSHLKIPLCYTYRIASSYQFLTMETLLDGQTEPEVQDLSAIGGSVQTALATDELWQIFSNSIGEDKEFMLLQENTNALQELTNSIFGSAT